MYFSVKAYANVPEKGRGVAADRGTFKFAWLDLDYGIEGHKSEQNPATREDALGLINQFPHAPTLIIFTGHGLQAFWFFDKSVDATEENGRLKVSHLVDALQSTIAQYAAVKGWQVDNTADLARIMRVPGTINYKDPANPVQGTILEFQPDRRYSVDQLLAACLPIARGRTKAGSKQNRIAAEAGPIPESVRSNTLISLAGGMRRYGMSEGAIATALIEDNLARCKPPLQEDEVKRIAHSACKYAPGHTQADDVINAQAALAEMMPQIVMTPGRVFKPDSLQALAVLQMFDTPAYNEALTNIKTSSKGKVTISKLELSVRGEASKMRAERQAAS